MTSDGVAWEEDRSEVLAMAEGEHPTPGYIPLAGTDSEGWRYKATVRESDGRLVVAHLSVTAPAGGESGLSAKLRAISVPAILEFAGEWEAERRNPSKAKVRKDHVDLARALGYTDEQIDEVVNWMEQTDFPPASSFFPPRAVERMDERKAGRRRTRGRKLDRDTYANTAIAYLLAAAWSPSPNKVVAERARRSPGWEQTTAKNVGDWVRIAASDRFGFLTGMSQGRVGAKPTAALFEWAEQHKDQSHVQEFLRKFGKGER